ncbi:MAG: histidinol-phosphate transaminase [Oscillospiraceae bacterium]|nr:histidinol-phosphate transaminase [Oscillospiraceae bacterium]
MSRFLSRRFEALSPYVPGEQPQMQNLIKLNTNENPYPPAPAVIAAMNDGEIEDLRLYSDPTAKVLKEKLAALYGLKPENIYVGNGSDEVLYFLFRAYGQQGAAFPDISYGFYSVFAQVCGIPATVIPLESDFSVDPEKYHGLNRFIVIANPNAPTGLSISLDVVEGILASNPDAVVAIDEAYVDFGGESAYPLMAKYDNLVVVRTFSKSRSMAGARLGYALAPAALIADLEKIKYSVNPYNVNRLTLRLGEATVDAEGYYQEKCTAIVATRQRTAEALKTLGFTVLPSQTNFLFAKSDKIGGRELYENLKDRGILVRHFGNPRIADFVRITIGTDAQMDACLDAIRGILEECV